MLGYIPHEASTSAVAVQKGPTKKGSRLKQAGIEVMEEFYKNVSERPTLTQKKELLKRIQAIPGCEDYVITKITLWFGRRRAKPERSTSTRRITPVGHPSETDPVNTTLTTDTIRHLSILSQGQANPPLDIILTWATLLKVDPLDIKSWLITQHPQAHLPSPVLTEFTTSGLTASPDPGPDTPKPEPTRSPVVEFAKKEIETISQPTTPLHQNTFLPVDVIRDIAKIAAKLPTQTQSHNLPRTAAEFNAMFLPTEAMKDMIRILRSKTSTSA